VLGDIALRYWLELDNRLWYWVGLVLYFGAAAMLAESYKTHHIAVASVAQTIFNVAIITIILWRVFGDTITVKQIIGLILAIVVIWLLES
jgi:multidrug transporter EmrE-like cation transporter